MAGEFGSYYRRVNERRKKDFREHFRGQVKVSLIIAAIVGVIALLAGQGVTSTLYGLAGFGLYIAYAEGKYALRAPVSLNAEVSAERDQAIAERDALREPSVVPVSIERLPDLLHSEGLWVLFRASVRNIGNRRAEYAIRVAELFHTAPHGPEAPFDLPWRHGNNVLYAEITPDDDERWFDIAQMRVLPIEPPDQAPFLHFRILAREGEGPEDHYAPFVGIDSLDALRQATAYTRITIRHKESGRRVANKLARFYYDEVDGRLVPQMQLSDV